jgi:hypothetical protein
MSNIEQLTDQEVLAMTAYGENRGGGVVGMTSVLNVIMNRANHPSWWGNSPRDCCLKPEQFDVWDQNDPNYQIILSVNSIDAVYAQALDLAGQALNGSLADITKGATYYFANSMEQKPYWAKGHTPCAVIAGQQFYNDIA